MLAAENQGKGVCGCVCVVCDREQRQKEGARSALGHLRAAARASARGSVRRAPVLAHCSPSERLLGMMVWLWWKQMTAVSWRQSEAVGVCAESIGLRSLCRCAWRAPCSPSGQRLSWGQLPSQPLTHEPWSKASGRDVLGAAPGSCG